MPEGRSLAPEIVEYNARQDLALDRFPSAEAQAGAIADDIAYDAHDIDDGLRAGMFSLEDLRPAPRSAKYSQKSQPVTPASRWPDRSTNWCGG